MDESAAIDAAKQIMSASAWIKGIAWSVASSIFGGASKLAIRKSWLMEQHPLQPPPQQQTATNRNDTYSYYNNIVDDGDIDTILPHHSNDSDGSTASSSNSDIILLRTATIQQREHLQSYTFPAYPQRWQSISLRVFGMIGMTFLNPLCSVLAMNYASPSILAPFSGLTLVWIVLFSEPLIGEKPSIRQIIAAALIVLGEVIIAFFGDHTNDEGITVNDVVRPPFNFHILRY
jgi:EamA-like transporter family